MKGRILFLRKEHSKQFGKWVCWFTGEIYSHCLIQPNIDSAMAYSTSCETGKCSITLMNDHSHPHDVFEFESNQIVVKECEKLLGTPYDMIGALHSIMPYNAQCDKKFYCSEMCAEILKKTVYPNLESTSLTPEQLHNVLHNIR